MTSVAKTRRWSGRHAVIAFALLAVALGAAEATGLRRAAWRAAYPYLPARVQALPYVAAGELRRLSGPSDSQPAPLPTALQAAPTIDVSTPTPTPTLAPGPSALPREGRTASVPTPTRTEPVSEPTAARPAAASVTGMRHEYQTWNNCGPATVSMALSAFGWQGDQRVAAAGLKPDPDDKNVGPDELARFARESGLNALVRSGGTIERLEALLAAGLPVIVETWFIPEPGDEMGHYVLLTGYDSGARTFTAFDSYKGPDVAIQWDAFDALWRVFGRLYVVVYPDAQAERVAAILGPHMDEEAMWVAAAATARQETLDRDDAFAHFNLGTALTALGEPEAAAGAFDAARARGLPWRMLWYQFAPYEAYGAAGRWEDVLALADATLARVGNLEESLYWRGRARAALGDAAGARADWRQAVLVNPLYSAPAEALEAIEAQDG